MACIDIYCNWCGERFGAPDHSQRFCGRTCSGGFMAARRRGNPSRQPVRYQARVLDALRANHGKWLTTPYLAARLWGCDDAATLNAVYHTMRRLRQGWGGAGLVIESAKRGTEPYRYRLVADPFKQAVRAS